MNKFFKTTGAIVGIGALTGAVFLLTSNTTMFQSNLLSDQNATLPLEVVQENGNANAIVSSSIFDATPSVGLPELSTGSVMSGLVMTGTTLSSSSESLVRTMDDVTSLENLRPAATSGAESFISSLGLSNSNENTNTTAVASAVTTPATEKQPSETNKLAEESLKKLPKVPQTGAESWLLSASILCAMMGMTMLLSSPQK